MKISRKRSRRSKKARLRRQLFETLEPRQLLAVVSSLSGNDLNLTGDEAADSLLLRANDQNQIEFSTDGGSTFNHDLDPDEEGVQSREVSTLSSITIDLGAGDDALELEETLTDLLRFNGVVIGLEGGVGDDSLTGPIADSSWSVTSENTGALAIGATPIVNFTNTENLVGRGIDTLAGPDQATTWNVTGEDSGNLQNGSSTLINFSGIPHLSGGSGDDTFNIIDSGVVGDGGQLSGPLDGGGGTDTIDYSGYDHEILISVALSVGTALESFTNVESFVGGNHNYTTPGLTESATSAVRIGERVQVGDRIYTYIGENDLTPLSLAPLTIENSPNGVLYEDTNFWAISWQHDLG